MFKTVCSLKAILDESQSIIKLKFVRYRLSLSFNINLYLVIIQTHTFQNLK